MKNINKVVKVGSIQISNNDPICLLAGPCIIESLDHALFMAEAIKKICLKLGINYIFKSSFDKANRNSINSFRGVGIEKGLKILETVKQQVGVLVTTDVHLPNQAKSVAEVCDILQVPAFLSRQSDLLEAIAQQHKPVNVKKMQSAAPWTMEDITGKLEFFGNSQVLLTDRGTSFGYGTLVMDMRSFPVMAKNGYPVIVDCTHAVQHVSSYPTTNANRDMAQVLASAAVAVGVAGVFAEVHDNPPAARSDPASMIYLNKLENILQRLLLLDQIAKKHPLQYDNYNIVM